MTWLYVPSVSATGSEVSSLGSDSPESTYSPWLALSGTATQRPFSWPGWKNRGWISRLSGTISRPSTAAHGAAAWISSLPVSPVNRSRRPGTVAVSMTSDGSGRTLPGSSLMWNRDSCSWRTSPTLFDSGYLTSSPTLPTSGSMRNGVCSQRAPLVPLIAARGSGSWPTPVAHDSTGNDSIGPTSFQTLTRSVSIWPITIDTVRRETWPTPVGSDSKAGGTSPSATHGESLLDAMLIHSGLSRPVRAMTPDGSAGAPKVDLNPRFVASLMGVPMGWLTPCTLGETDWSRWLLAMRSLSSLIDSEEIHDYIE